MEYAQAYFLYIALIKICDALTVLGVWYACWDLRFSSTLFSIPKGIPIYENYSTVAPAMALVFCSVFHIVGAYKRDRIHFGFKCAKKVTESCILGLLAFISILYFIGEVDYSRLYLIIFLLILLPAILLVRALLQGIWNICEKTVIRRVRVLLVGEGELLSMYVSTLKRRTPYPIEWLGRVGDKKTAPLLDNIPYLGKEDRLEQLLELLKIDTVVISYPTETNKKYEAILKSVSNELIGIKVLPEFGKFSTFSYQAEEECGIPLLQFNHLSMGATDRAVKRLLDISGSIICIFLFSPIFLIIWLLVRLTSTGPALYKQERLGADGRVFALYKFRSMRLDAELITGAIWATEKDPRVTPVGKWIRKTSLDELPQLFNVLAGDMSLVGPRPERPVFVEQFRKEIPKYMLRHKMKSGITGWAQVNGWRGDTSLEERIKHDLYYIGHWSHLLDLKILSLTLIKGFVNRHAY